MILSRVAPIEQTFDRKTPCWSGPRCSSVATASGCDRRLATILMGEAGDSAQVATLLAPRL